MSEETATLPSRAARIDVFGGQVTERVELGDGNSWIDVKRMNEGERRKYLSSIQRPMKVSRDGQAEIDFNPAGDRQALLTATICDWDVTANGESLPFSDAGVKMLLKSGNVEIIDKVEKAAREANPWLLDEVTAEDLEKQIADLEELLEKKLAEEAGND